MANKLSYPTLLKVLLSQNCYESIMRIRQKFSIFAEKAGSDAIKHYWRYCEKFREAPANRKALEEYVSGIAAGGIEAINPELDEIEGEEPNIDFNSAFDEAFKEADRRYVHRYMLRASVLASGSLPEGDTNLKRSMIKIYGEEQEKWNWTEAAEKFTQERRIGNPFKLEDDRSGGIYQENTEKIRERIQEAFLPEDANGALLTGFPTVDDNVIIGTGFHQCRFVGVAGQSGRGKTLTLLSTTYNMARQGKTILFNALEHSYDDTHMLMQFLHASYFADEGKFTIPPLDVWAQGYRAKNPVGPMDIKNFETVLKDAASYTNLKGPIHATQYHKWDDIVAHVETSKLKFDVVVIDYLEALDDAQGKYGNDDEYVNLIKRVKKWCLDRDMVVLTPLTITKEGAKAAEEFDPENPGKPFPETAVRGSSSILYWMDLILGVHSTADMRDKFELYLWGVKKRFGKKDPPITLLKVDPNTKHVRDIRGRIERREVAEQTVTMDDMTGGAF
jgi:DnaB-like helicase C terminal domain